MPRLSTSALRDRLHNPCPTPSSDSKQPLPSHLRTRLGSGGSIPRANKKKSTTARHPRRPSIVSENVYQHLDACFALEPSPPPTAEKRLLSRKNNKRRIVDDSVDKSLESLTDAFTQAGTALHALTVDTLGQNFSHLEEKITAFGHCASALTHTNDRLYENFCAPLSATRCLDDAAGAKLPRATIAAHLKNVAQGILEGEKVLSRLGVEWVSCVREEERLWKTVGEGESGVGVVVAESLAQQMSEFGQEVKNIAAAKSRELDSVEKEYQDLIRLETSKMMESFMEE